MKGTPSASEVEFLIYLLEQKLADLPAETRLRMSRKSGPRLTGWAIGIAAESVLPQLAGRVEAHLERLLDSTPLPVGQVREKTAMLARSLKGTGSGRRFRRRRSPGWLGESRPARRILRRAGRRTCSTRLVAEHPSTRPGRRALQRSFLSAFTRHQPQYLPEACLVASGSNRTAWASWASIAGSPKWSSPT